MSITVTKIRQSKPKAKTYRILDGDGLYLEIKPNGKRFWRYRYKKADGKMTMISLGEYPQTAIDAARRLAEARRAQGRYLHRTFEDIALEWHSRKPYRSQKNSEVEWGRVRNYLLPTLGDMQISRIEPIHIMPILELIEEKGYLELARRVRSIASQIFRYGVSKVACSGDPADLLKGSTKAPTVRHMPALVDEKGFADLLRRVDAAEHLMPTVKLALQLAPYLVLRSGEIRTLRPEYVQDDLIVIPKEIMKTKRDHIVPLSSQAKTLIHSALRFSDSLLLPGLRKGRPMSENTLNVALRSLAYNSGEVVFHGYRSSFATLGREILHFHDDLIERQLAHVDRNQVRAAYDRSYRLSERREMMVRWADYLDSLKSRSITP